MVSFAQVITLVLCLDAYPYRPSAIDGLLNLINAGMQARYSGNAAPESQIALRRSLEILNAILKEFTNMKMMTGIRTCGRVCLLYCDLVVCYLYIYIYIYIYTDRRAIAYDHARLLLHSSRFATSVGSC
jgi:hypothetical protein